MVAQSKVRSAGIYCRISEDRIGDEAGVRRQEADCRSLAELKEWPVAKVYSDSDVSAWDGKTRPAYQELLRDLRDGLIDAVVVWNLDRLHRQPKELETFFEVCDQAGVRAMATVSGDVDLATDDGRFHARILGAVARKSSDDTSRRIRRKMEANARNGRAHGGGTRPFGFLADKVTVNEAEAVLIKEAAQRVLAGESLRAVVADWNAREIPTSSARTRWSPTTLKGVLISPRLAGKRVHQGEVIGDAVWKPIISQATHTRLVRILTDAKRRTSPGNARSYLLSGFVVCSKCGARMVARPRAGTRTYTCAKEQGGCGGRRIVAEPLETLVRDALFVRFDSPALSEVLAAQEDTGEENALLNSIREDEDALTQLAEDHYAARLITRQEFLAAREAIETRIGNTRRELAVRSGSRVLANLPTGRLALEREWSDRDLSWRRAVLGLFIEKVIIEAGRPGATRLDPDRVRISWHR